MIYYIQESAKNKKDTIKINIYGRKFELNIRYQKYTGEEIIESQYDAVSKFKHANIDSSLDKVKKFIIKDSKDYGDHPIDSIDNIFKYIKPKYLFVPRDDKGIVAIMCDYKIDLEHGLAIVFKNGSYTNVGTQDIIL